MNVEELRECCLSVKGASESFPFVKFGRGAENILAFKVMEKMFAYIDLLPKDGVHRVWFKGDPEELQRLRQQYRGMVSPGQDREKYWSGVELVSDVPDPVLKRLIESSVTEVIKKLPRKKREEYEKR
ncbi:MAG: MmcQ/YjbR family DNA-binding protein [Bacteroides sp.]|nr:MmcQ/YjbR family DNA-binding protein [Bacteroides sp.]